MSSAQTPEELIVWQLADRLKIGVYELIASGPMARDRELCDQLRRAASSAPRLIAEGFGRYLPGDFSRYLRSANGELNEILDCLKDAVDRGHCTVNDVAPLQRLAKRASKAATRLIAYLRTARAPNEPQRRRDRRPRTTAPENPENPENP